MPHLFVLEYLGDRFQTELVEEVLSGQAPLIVTWVKSMPRCCQHPDIVWALQGLVECAAALGDADRLQLLCQRLTLALTRADTAIACFCRRETIVA